MTREPWRSGPTRLLYEHLLEGAGILSTGLISGDGSGEGRGHLKEPASGPSLSRGGLFQCDYIYQEQTPADALPSLPPMELIV